MAYKKVEIDGRTKQSKEMPHKWSEVIGLMVLGGLDFQPAMIAAGYSEKYADTNGHKIKKDERFSKALEDKRAKIVSKSEDRREKRLKNLDEFIEDKDLPARDRIAAIKEQGAICGWHTETIKHETTERQAILDSNNRAEAARLALLALDTRQLPDVTSQGRKVVTSQCRDMPMTDDMPMTEDMPMTDDTIIHPIDFGA